MTRPNPASFADELTKLGGAGSLIGRLIASGKSSAAGKAIRTLVNDLKHSPEHRKAVLHSALLGGGTGAAGAVAGGGDEPAWKRALRGGVGGAVAGGATGAMFPGWFTASNRRLAR